MADINLRTAWQSIRNKFPGGEPDAASPEPAAAEPAPPAAAPAAAAEPAAGARAPNVWRYPQAPPLVGPAEPTPADIQRSAITQSSAATNDALRTRFNALQGPQPSPAAAAPEAAVAAAAPETAAARAPGFLPKVFPGLRAGMAAESTPLAKAAYGVGRVAGAGARGLGPAAIGASVISHFNDYKINDPDVDSSVGGIWNALRAGDLRMAGRGVSKDALETSMDLNSTAANLLDYVVPGKQPVSRYYDKLLREQFGDQLVAHPSVEAALAPAEPPVDRTLNDTPRGTMADLIARGAPAQTQEAPAEAAPEQAAPEAAPFNAFTHVLTPDGRVIGPQQAATDNDRDMVKRMSVVDGIPGLTNGATFESDGKQYANNQVGNDQFGRPSYKGIALDGQPHFAGLDPSRLVQSYNEAKGRVAGMSEADRQALAGYNAGQGLQAGAPGASQQQAPAAAAAPPGPGRDTIGRSAKGYTPFGAVADPAARSNIQAFSHALATVEGGDYNKIVGGGSFTDFAAHPNKVGLTTKDGDSTAAGRYQITGPTFKDIAKQQGLTDFSPKSQDQAMLALLQRRGALNDVTSGNFDEAVKKLGDEWQGLPSGTSKNQGKSTDAKWQSALAEGRAMYGGGAAPAAAAATADTAAPQALRSAAPQQQVAQQPQGRAATSGLRDGAVSVIEGAHQPYYEVPDGAGGYQHINANTYRAGLRAKGGLQEVLGDMYANEREGGLDEMNPHRYDREKLAVEANAAAATREQTAAYKQAELRKQNRDEARMDDDHLHKLLEQRFTEPDKDGKPSFNAEQVGKAQQGIKRSLARMGKSATDLDTTDRERLLAATHLLSKVQGEATDWPIPWHPDRLKTIDPIDLIGLTRLPNGDAQLPDKKDAKGNVVPGQIIPGRFITKEGANHILPDQPTNRYDMLFRQDQ